MGLWIVLGQADGSPMLTSPLVLALDLAYARWLAHARRSPLAPTLANARALAKARVPPSPTAKAHWNCSDLAP